MSVPFAPGEHDIVLEVEDVFGAISRTTASFQVVDTQPPHLSVTLTPAILWPPSNQMVEIDALIEAIDACSASTIALSDVIVQDVGHIGERAIQGADLGTPDTSFLLRARRAGNGSGRTYQVLYTSTDAAGNRSETTATVVVPHDQSN